MSDDLSVSVIIPAYNCVESLGECLDSVFQQTHRPIEVIVVDDGSTDDTATVARSNGAKVQVITQENKGQGAARNAGLKLAKGKYIAFLDADDFWRPGFLRACVEFLTVHEEVVAVSTGCIVRRLDGAEHVHPARLCGNGRACGVPFVIGHFFEFWASYDHVRTGSSLIRRSVINEAGGQRADLRISQDLEYWGYIATFGKWGYIPEPLWVGNSRAAARTAGWLTKYRKRRALCPDVEEWESRILPRLLPADHAGFEIVRGRVAMGYAQNKILGGARGSAYHIVRKYGNAMPRCTMSRLLRHGCRWGRISWAMACGLVCFREYSKAIRLSLSSWL